MKNSLAALLAMHLGLLPIVSYAIDESTARKIAEKAAGCDHAKICETRARIENNQWHLIISTIYGYRENGEPIFKPGGWVGFTISQDGMVLNRQPGR